MHTARKCASYRPLLTAGIFAAPPERLSRGNYAITSERDIFVQDKMRFILRFLIIVMLNVLILAVLGHVR
jgi:hypothetical protein